MKRTKIPELLAPAGGPDAAYAALHYGADAIYLGLSQFSARAHAENFDFDVLNNLVGYAHTLEKKRRVYVTMNTLVQQRELPRLIEELYQLSQIDVDALIVQDLGVASIIREYFPSLELHASTQMAVFDRYGATKLKDLGFTRVVLARELSLKEVADIHAHSGIETEIFIHGALCYSYSGLCLFSAHANQRSGNRGQCSYCCRDHYQDEKGQSNMPFSMKDLCLAPVLEEVCQTGVTSLKIEGRMKNPLYVASVTDYYRKLLDQSVNRQDAKRLEENVRTVFSRPWTTLYSLGIDAKENVVDDANQGHQGALIGRVKSIRIDEQGGRWIQFKTSRRLEKHDGIQFSFPHQRTGFSATTFREVGSKQKFAISVEAQKEVEILLPEDFIKIRINDKVYCTSSQEVKRSYPFTKPSDSAYSFSYPIDVMARLTKEAFSLNAKAVLDFKTIEVDVSVLGSFESAKNPDSSYQGIKKGIARLGDSEWKLNHFTLENDSALFAPASIVNALRREMAEALKEKADEARKKHLQHLIAAICFNAPCKSDHATKKWSIKVRDHRMLEELIALSLADKMNELVLPVESLAELPIDMKESVLNTKIRLSLPLIFRAINSDELINTLKLRVEQGWHRWEVSNLSALQLLKEANSGSIENLDISGDWSLNVFNSRALNQYGKDGIERIVLSPEDDQENILHLIKSSEKKCIVLAFQYTPLFISATTPQTKAKESLTSRYGEHYSILKEGHTNLLVSDKPMSLSGKLDDLNQAGAEYFRIDLSHAPKNKYSIQEIWESLSSDRPIKQSHLGNFKRGVL